MSKIVRIGSRGSDLALWQAHFFQDRLKEIGVASEITIIKTKGDRIQDLSFDKIEGKGFFTKEIEEVLLKGEVDVAIHSHKDLETTSPPGLIIAGVSYRENPADLLLIRPECVDVSQKLGFKKGAVVGTSSARRKSQVKAFRPDISIKDIRGNVPTRIDKLRSGDFDAILLAAAGVARLGLDLSDLVVKELDPKLFIPAPAQGVLAYQCREGDSETISIIQRLHDPDVASAIAIERSILKSFGGGCQIPIGAHTSRTDNGFRVRVSYGTEWQSMPRRLRFDCTSEANALATFELLKTNPLPKSIFVSSTLDPGSAFHRYCSAHSIQVTAQSLIEIVPKPFELPDEAFEWLFFTSANGVKVFFDAVESEELKGKRFAAVGESTAQMLGHFVEQIDYVGESSDTTFVGQAFSKILGRDAVVFPGSAHSLRNIQSQLAQDQVFDIATYTTSDSTKEITVHDAYVFTSPSNVEAFSRHNQMPKDAVVVAIGKSTAAALSERGFTSRIADIAEPFELLALIAS